MPKYLIVRTFTVDADEMPVVGHRSKKIAQERFPQIVWEHSHVVVDDDGKVRTYCVYDAPSVNAVREHATRLGKHQVDSVEEIAGDVTPADFPSV
jgi:hypothetical protein